ncbi:replication initiation factor domain-containing protein [Latilactobacillus curvatus]|uniref:replication initiation factor domain-containing protein n=2 Tax=Latilactobacillus curvatus TaxID=28038 RepID=UPI0020745C52|nr:replication initiation factor domain-containing protein [Latilactobacillus curvatus]MCM6845057.1 replication initiation factor domain-containing protein [Latilactobacillus curvatus]
MGENLIQTPYSNTGSSCTDSPRLTSCVDWFSVTFKDVVDWHEICAILQLDFSDFIEMENGLNGYKSGVKFGDILILFDGTDSMGIHLQMSGQGCRQYESHFTDYNWSDLFAMIMNYDYNVSRLDLAIDDFIGLLNLTTLSNKARKGHVVSTLSHLVDIEKIRLSDGVSKGRTLYFGSGKLKIRFYDKKQEREAKGYDLVDDVDVWQRYELQLRSEKATAAMKVLAYDNYELGEFIRGIYKATINFKVPNVGDSNKRRWTNCKWWDDFLGQVDAIQFTQQAPEPTILKSKLWVDRQVTGTLAMLNNAFNNELITRYFVKKGQDKLTEEQNQLAGMFKNDDQAKLTVYRQIMDDLGENEFLKLLQEIPAAQKKEITRLMGLI